MTNEQIADLEQRIAHLQARLPKHTPPPRMLIELEELEEALERGRGHANSGEPTAR